MPRVSQDESTGPGASCSGVARCRASRTPSAPTPPLDFRQQTPSRQVQIRQAARDEEPVRILCEPLVADLGPPKDALHHPEHMFDFGPHLRLGPIAGPFPLTQRPMASGLGLDEALRLRSRARQDLALSAVRRIAPDARLLPVSQIQ